MAAIDNTKKSARLLASRRYTHDTYTDAQEAFTSTLDINANEVYVDQSLIPSASLPFSGSGQNGNTYSVNGQDVVKYWYRQPLTKSDLNNEVWFFLDPEGAAGGIGAQIIDATQLTNFVSPKYAVPALANANTEDATPGYGVKVFVSTNASTPASGDQVSVNNYSFDYKTGVIQFATSAVAPTAGQYVYVSAYQYVGRTLKDNITSVSASIAAINSSLGGGGDIGNSVTLLNSFSASQNTKNSTLATYTGSVDTKWSTLQNVTSSLNTFTASILTAITASGTNVIINGDLTVKGTTTSINSTTIDLGDNIISLNGTGAANGGLVVKDPTSPNTVSGSLLWDSTNDYWKAGPLGSEDKILRAGSDNVVSSSAQIVGILSSLNSYTSSQDTKNSTLATLSGSIGTKFATLENVTSSILAFTGSENTKAATLASYTSSLETKFSTLGSYTASVETKATTLANVTASILSYTSSQDTKNSTLASYTGSVTTRFTTLENVTASILSYTSSQDTKNSTLATYTTSVDSRLNQLSTDSGSQAARISSLEARSASVETKFSTLATYTASVETKASTLATYTASIETKFTTLQSLTSSNGARLTALEGTSASVETKWTTLANVTSSILSFTGSQNTKNSTLATYTASVDNSISAINAFTNSFGTSFSQSVDSRLDTLEGTGTIQGVGTGNQVTFAKVSTTGDVVVGGDLVVQGNTVTLNTAQLVVEDKLISLASGSTNAATANGAGIEVLGANATLTYESTNNAWTTNIPISSSAVTASVNIPGYGTSKRMAFRSTSGNIDFVAAPTTAGDIPQWDGTNFVMSNVIDGGTY